MAALRPQTWFVAAIFTLLTACGGGGGGGGGGGTTDVAGGGIGGTGISSGPITATGTVTVASLSGPVAAAAVTTSATPVPTITVNRVKYQIPATAKVTLNGAMATGDALRVGQVVTISFTGDPATGTATAKAVTYDPNLTGPVTKVDPGKKTITLLGQTVRIDTLLEADDKDGSNINLDQLLDKLSPDDLLEISGERDGDGVLHATRIERKEQSTDPTIPVAVDVEGTVTGLTTDHFTLDTLKVEIPQGLVVDGTLKDGAEVDVKGSLSGTTLTASGIEVKESPVAGQQEDSQVELKGFITATDRLDTDNEITVDGVVVRLTDATEIRGDEEEVPASRVDLNLNVEVKVEGRADGLGAVVAERISLD